MNMINLQHSEPVKDCPQPETPIRERGVRFTTEQALAWALLRVRTAGLGFGENFTAAEAALEKARGGAA